MAARFAALAFLLLAACVAPSAEDSGGAPAPGEGAEIGKTGGMCGGIAGFQCDAEGDYCAYGAGACVEIADAAGVCRTRPQVCTMEYAPVCGCDGKTYSNSCSAAGAGVSVAYEGACRA